MEEPCCKKPPNHFSLAWAYFSKLSKGKDRVSVAESRNELPGFPCLVTWCPDKLPAPPHPLKLCEQDYPGVSRGCFWWWGSVGTPLQADTFGDGSWVLQATGGSRHSSPCKPLASCSEPRSSSWSLFCPLAAWLGCSESAQAEPGHTKAQCAWLRVGVGLVRSLSSWSLPSG